MKCLLRPISFGLDIFNQILKHNIDTVLFLGNVVYLSSLHYYCHLYIVVVVIVVVVISLILFSRLSHLCTKKNWTKLPVPTATQTSLVPSSCRSTTWVRVKKSQRVLSLSSPALQTHRLVSLLFVYPKTRASKIWVLQVMRSRPGKTVWMKLATRHVLKIPWWKVR